MPAQVYVCVRLRALLEYLQNNSLSPLILQVRRSLLTTAGAAVETLRFYSGMFKDFLRYLTPDSTCIKLCDEFVVEKGSKL